MRIGYLVNQYPKVSHTFVRREIRALEARGVTVERFSVRDTSAEVKDDDDRAELVRTRVLLPTDRAEAAAALASATARLAATRPGRFREASALAIAFAQSLRRLEPWMRRLGEAARLADIRFVMDGPRAAHQTLGPTVRVEWTGGQGENRADQVIGGMLRVSDMSMPTWVITRDTDLGRRAREAGAVVEAPEAFTRRAVAAGIKADTFVGGGGGPRR